MSIGIAIAVPDGIALAADTQTTWIRSIEKAKDKQTGNDIELADPIRVPVGWSRMARKLFSVDINGVTYAILTAGEAQLNLKTMYAVFRSGAKKYTGNGEFSHVSRFFVEHIKNELAAQHSCSVNDLSQQGKSAYYFPDTESIIEFLVGESKPGDLILIMSNGAFDNIHVRLLESL